MYARVLLAPRLLRHGTCKCNNTIPMPARAPNATPYASPRTAAESAHLLQRALHAHHRQNLVQLHLISQKQRLQQAGQPQHAGQPTAGSGSTACD